MEAKKTSVSTATLNRWWLFMLLSVTGLAILFSSVYFLYFPVGFQGGRNPDYGTIIVFNREMWDVIHLWSGIGMIIVLVVHITVHDKWILVMYKRLFRGKTGGIKSLNQYARFNILLDAVAALSFLLVTVSGVILLFYPSGRNIQSIYTFIFTKEVWDVIHTWSGVVMLVSAILLFYIHWRWITKITRRVVGIKKTEKLAKDNSGIQMIKKFVLGVVVLSISAVLLFGGVYRTIARADTGEQANQSEKNLSITKGNLEERGFGQGNGLVNDLSAQQGGGNRLESTRVATGEELKDIVSFLGIVTQIEEDLFVILCGNGNEIVVEGRALRFAIDAGFSAEIGDSIALNGFYETIDKFEISYIENLTKNIEVQIREESGRSLWAGNGRGA